ncbi:hypothetical protein ABB07_17260 [Streptomyces incarnatus]|uniref:Antitoxin VbhA domain-containing protein n=1 Tax=Streptomyces incarnatus TaxID=665007 RepID=A0ABN4GHE9_9ACTN|nr:hypothetical protein [Streptomyces incarnatus]AKJ11722.1 hypothetical protein ABB07_17260 [Streptomyces incarnatus]
MTMWIRVYDEASDLWQYFESDEEGRVLRQVEVRGADGTPVTAAALEEVLRYEERADVAVMSRYEQRYGLVAEGRLTAWEEAARAGAISAEEFERVWLEARRTLGSTAPPTDTNR